MPTLVRNAARAVWNLISNAWKSSTPTQYDVFVPVGSDDFITSDGDTFCVRQ